MSFSNKPEFNEEMKVRLATSEHVSIQGPSDCMKVEAENTGTPGLDEFQVLTEFSSASGALAQENSGEIGNAQTCRQLSLGTPWGYWVAVAFGGALSTILLFLSVILPEFGWYFTLFIFVGLGLSSWACEYIGWRRRTAVAVNLGSYRWADVVVVRQPECFDDEMHLHVLINKTLLLPVSEIDNGFDQNLFLEIIRQPEAKRKVFYLPGSDLPVAVATESAYLLLGRAGGSFLLRYAVPLTLIVLGAQCLLFWKFGNVFNFSLLP